MQLPRILNEFPHKEEEFTTLRKFPWGKADNALDYLDSSFQQVILATSSGTIRKTRAILLNFGQFHMVVAYTDYSLFTKNCLLDVPGERVNSSC